MIGKKENPAGHGGESLGQSLFSTGSNTTKILCDCKGCCPVPCPCAVEEEHRTRIAGAIGRYLDRQKVRK